MMRSVLLLLVAGLVGCEAIAGPPAPLPEKNLPSISSYIGLAMVESPTAPDAPEPDGKCSTCNGKGWVGEPFGGNQKDCPDCETPWRPTDEPSFREGDKSQPDSSESSEVIPQRFKAAPVVAISAPAIKEVPEAEPFREAGAAEAIPEDEGSSLRTTPVAAYKTAGNAPYGYCPDCGAPGVTRERRLNGNDYCENGHPYPSSSALDAPRRAKAASNRSPGCACENCTCDPCVCRTGEANSDRRTYYYLGSDGKWYPTKLLSQREAAMENARLVQLKSAGVQVPQGNVQPVPMPYPAYKTVPPVPQPVFQNQLYTVPMAGNCVGGNCSVGPTYSRPRLFGRRR